MIFKDKLGPLLEICFGLIWYCHKLKEGAFFCTTQTQQQNRLVSTVLWFITTKTAQQNKSINTLNNNINTFC